MHRGARALGASMSLSGFKGAGWQPTPYLRLFKKDIGGAYLRQWWEDETGAGEWRPIDMMIGEPPGWDGDPRTTPANTVVDKKEAR
jgi:hypothetical protein